MAYFRCGRYVRTKFKILVVLRIFLTAKGSFPIEKAGKLGNWSKSGKSQVSVGKSSKVGGGGSSEIPSSRGYQRPKNND